MTGRSNQQALGAIRGVTLCPVTFKLDNEELVATITATDGQRELRIVARCSPTGVVHDIQATGASGEFYAGTTGTPDLDLAVNAAIEHAYAAARNAAVVLELDRRLRFRGRRHRR